jgi:predicted lipoprotein
MPAYAGFGRYMNLLGAVLIITSVTACNNDDDDDDSTMSFDRKAMLTNYADNLIIPGYEGALESAEQLQTDLAAFINDPTENNLVQTQMSWEAAYRSYLHVAGFNFGPASTPVGTLSENIGTYPADTTGILDYIAVGDNSLDNFDRDTRGYIGLDFLLFDLNNRSQYVINRFSDSKVGDYATAVVDDIVTRLNETNTDWSTYRDEFISNSGTDPGSSTSAMYNEFVKLYEAHKNFKVGLPAGKRAGQTEPEPTQVEGYYSGLSLNFQAVSLEVIDHLYQGTSWVGSSGSGWTAYLQTVVGGPELITSTTDQWAAVNDAFEALPAERFSETVVNQAAELDTYYTELSKQTRIFKSDMSSVLGIAITYDSGDGD